jgi:guanylate kinase
VEYRFVQRPAFEELLRSERFLEHAEVHGHLYGTCWSEHEEAQRAGVDLVLDLDVQGAAQLRQKLPDAVTVFVLPPSFEVLSGRLRARGQDDEATVRRRLKGAREELGRFGEYDYAIVNEDLERSVEALACVIRSARCRTSRLERTAQEILETFQVE